MTKPIFSWVCTLLLGVVFILSAFLKAWTGNDFADIVLQYGIEWLPALVPVLIAVELLLGLALLLRIYPRYTSMATAAFLVGVSAMYLYGVLFRHVTDCGCFGPFHQLSASPAITFTRNAILLLLAGVGAWTSDKKPGTAAWKTIFILLLTAVTTFVCGLSMSRTYQLPNLAILQQEKAKTHTAEELGLTDYFTFEADSTYAVYLFSYTCPHCQNSFANIEQYQRLRTERGIAAVYGLAVENPDAKARFYRIYQPTIPIQEIPEEKMASITSGLPLLLIIKDGKVVNTEGGAITAPGIFVD